MLTAAPNSISPAIQPSDTRPTSTSAVISSVRRRAPRPDAPPTEAIRRSDLHGAVVLDVDCRAGLFRDRADDRAALADDFADLLRVDLDRDDRGRPLRHLGARLGQHLVHLAEDVQAAGLRLLERDL